MVFSITVDMCVGGDKCCNRHQMKKVAPFLDLIAGVALLIIGLLAMAGMMTMSTNTSWALIGAGGALTGLSIYKIIEKIKSGSRYSDTYLL